MTSENYRRKTRASSGEEPSYLLEITHPQLAEPIRVCNDQADLISGGNRFHSCGFRVRFPEDVVGVMPRVPCSIDNVGKLLTQWLDASNGGRDAEFRIMEVMRDTPDVIEREYTMTLLGAHQGVLEISGTLGYENFLEQPGLAATQTPELQPAIF